MPTPETRGTPADELNPTLKAEDIMTPNPRTCSPFSTVLEAVMIFKDADCGAVPVVEDGKPVGVLTDRDVALALADYPDLTRQPVSQIMSRNVVTVLPNATLETVSEKFGAHQLRRLVVADANDQIRGIIAWSDFAPHAPDRSVGQVVSETVQA